MRRSVSRPAVAVLTAAVLTVLAATALSGCTAARRTSATGHDKVAYMTAFGAVGRDAFIWVAKDKGYLADAGIDVTIQLGAGTDPNLKALSSGQVQIAANDLNGVTVSVGTGNYTDVRAFAAVNQRNLSSIVTLDGAGITSPKDLPGKKLGVSTGSVVKLLFPAYARLAGIDPASVHWVTVAAPALSGMLGKQQADGLATYLISTPAIQKLAGGRKAVVMPFSTYLTDLYGNALVTTATFARTHRDLLERFRGAILAGVRYTVEHPDEAGAIMRKYNPTIDAAAAAGEIRLMTPYVGAGDAAFGTLDQRRVARAIAILQGAGLFPPGLTPDRILATDLVPQNF